jgi:DNA topoisomerase-2
MRKTDGSSRRTVAGIPKLDDANWAGTRRGRLCTLILTEGDSAKSTAIAGLSVVGRDRFGVFPLRGKLINARDAPTAKLLANEEVVALKRIIGLESGRDYTTEDDLSRLRYGSVMLLTDQDVDGFHIKGLVLNFFHCLWPGLASTPGFLRSMATPIVRVSFPDPRPTLSFYSLPDLEAWRATRPGGCPGRVRYYKGLGTSSSSEAREYFSEMRLTTYRCDEPERPAGAVSGRVSVSLDVVPGDLVRLRVRADDRDALDMAFRKARSDDRKAWLTSASGSARPAEPGAGASAEMSLSEFVARELVQFSLEDIARSLPSAVDGLKRSQRKVVFGARANKQGEQRVSQLSGFIGQVSGYHHGEASLQQTIVGMAQSFVGCGHVQLMTASGQFGTRIAGGADCASARYIHTSLSEIAGLVLPRADEPVLERALDDDGREVEPRHYLPVLPLSLLNGASGIGTGFSVCLPCYCPVGVASAYADRLGSGAPLSEPARRRFCEALDACRPCYRGFTGEISPRRMDEGGAVCSWESCGTVRSLGDDSVLVTELPVGTWTQDFKEHLEALCSDPDSPYRRYVSEYTESDVRFVVYHTRGDHDHRALLRMRSDKGLSCSNIHMLDGGGRVRRFAGPGELAEEHFERRMDGYARRLAHVASECAGEVRYLEAKAEFVSGVLSGDVRLHEMRDPEAEVGRIGEARGWPRDRGGPQGGYGYLLTMPLSSLTPERHGRLLGDLERARLRLREALDDTAERAWLGEIRALLAALPPCRHAGAASAVPAGAAAAGPPVPEVVKRKRRAATRPGSAQRKE